MAARGYVQVTPRRTDPTVREEPVLDLTSGYVRRAVDALPRQGSRAPWRVHQNYVSDLLSLRRAALEDGVLEFRRAPAAAARPTASEAVGAGV
jgi:hypothetical protein